jgi:uncharacterized protein YerC
MPHVSKKRLKKKMATELADQFLTFLSNTRTKADARILARELLSQTERVMLAKRLSTIILLVRGYTFQQIGDSLGVTPQTVTRLWHSLNEEKYQKIVEYALARPSSPKQKESFMDAFIRAIHMGMPPRNDPNRRQKFRKWLYS